MVVLFMSCHSTLFCSLRVSLGAPSLEVVDDEDEEDDGDDDDAAAAAAKRRIADETTTRQSTQQVDSPALPKLTPEQRKQFVLDRAIVAGAAARRGVARARARRVRNSERERGVDAARRFFLISTRDAQASKAAATACSARVWARWRLRRTSRHFSAA